MSIQRLSKYFLVRSTPIGLDPTKSIMELEEKDANDIARQAGKESDQSYYRLRQSAEMWLKQKAINNGVNIKNENPLYFRLTEKEALFCYGKKINISLSGSTIDWNNCSITIGDSFYHYFFDKSKGKNNELRNKFMGRVLSAKEFINLGEDPNIVTTLTPNQHAYVEVQMWDRPNFKK